ncbi:MAG: hypothetical protein JWN04_4475 [Myxococcaceae bacterium]|nr:hypothetical protein [Myxococcaceae bacterium]
MLVSLSRLLACCLLYALLTLSASARAESADPARSASARTLFEEGLRKADAEQWPEAADLFQRALALRDSPVIRFNLGSALIELGRLVEASEQLRALEIDKNASPELRESATKSRELVLPRLAKLTIRVDGHDPSLLVLLDDRKVEPEQLGVAFPVDPRPHHVALRSGERLLDDEHVAPAEGESISVRLVGAVALPVVAATSTSPLVVGTLGQAPTRIDAGEPLADAAHDRRKRRIFWGVGAGAVAVAAGVVAAVLLAGHSSHDHSPSDPFSPGSVGVRVPQ